MLRRTFTRGVALRLVLGVALSLGAGWLVRRDQVKVGRLHFQAQADDVVAALRGELEQQVWTVAALQALWAASENVSAEEFRQFTGPLLARHPSIEACGWMPLVPAGQRAQFEAAARAEVAGAFELAELDARGCTTPAAVRAEHYPILYLEPRGALGRWLGLDLGADPARVALLERARDSGSAATSDPVRLLSAPTGSPGFVTVAPIYAPGVTPGDVDARRRLLRGFVGATFSIGAIVERAISRLEHVDIAVYVVDPSTASGGSVLYADAGVPAPKVAELLDTAALDHSAALALGGQEWFAICRPRGAATTGASTWAGLGTLLFGLLLTGALVGNQMIRERASQELRQSEERFRSMFERHHASMLLVDVQTNAIVEANPAAAEFYGYTREELRGRLITHINQAPLEVIHAALTDALLERRNQFLFPHRLRNGDVRQVEVHASPIDYQGRTLLFSIIHDVTDRLRAEAEREAMHERLLQSQKLESLGLVAGGVAHDFNNLLTVILGNAELARMRAGDDRELRASLDALVRSSERAAELTHQLLSYSGKAPSTRRVIDLSETVREFTPLVSRLMPASVELAVDLAAGLPRLHCDPIQVQQILMNLVLNASEACGQRAGKVRVTTRSLEVDASMISRWQQALPVTGELRPGSFVCLEVQDDGPGIEAATLARIFDPFFTTKFTGRGLGLATVSGLVRAHGGAVEVSSQPGRGACFRVFLPSAREATVIEAGAVPLFSPAEGVVLVVDDEPAVLEFARGTLQHFGFPAETVASGRAAIDLVRERGDQVRLVVLDLTMPDMSGVETLDRLRALRPDLGVVLSSGYSEREAHRICAGRAVTGFLQKPYLPRALANVVSGALATSKT